MSKTNVTNNHTGPLSIAGVRILPSATAAVDATKLEAWLTRPVAQTWISLGLLEVDEEVEQEPVVDNRSREELKAAAEALGLELPGNISNAKLLEAVHAAEDAD